MEPWVAAPRPREVSGSSPSQRADVRPGASAAASARLRRPSLAAVADVVSTGWRVMNRRSAISGLDSPAPSSRRTSRLPLGQHRTPLAPVGRAPSERSSGPGLLRRAALSRTKSGARRWPRRSRLPARRRRGRGPSPGGSARSRSAAAARANPAQGVVQAGARVAGGARDADPAAAGPPRLEVRPGRARGEARPAGRAARRRPGSRPRSSSTSTSSASSGPTMADCHRRDRRRPRGRPLKQVPDQRGPAAGTCSVAAGGPCPVPVEPAQELGRILSRPCCDRRSASRIIARRGGRDAAVEAGGPPVSRPAGLDPARRVEDAAVVGPAERGDHGAAATAGGGAHPGRLGHVVEQLAGPEESAEHRVHRDQVGELARAGRGDRLVEEDEALLGPVGHDVEAAEVGQRLELDVAVVEAAPDGDGLTQQRLAGRQVGLAERAMISTQPCKVCPGRPRRGRVRARASHPAARPVVEDAAADPGRVRAARPAAGPRSGRADRGVARAGRQCGDVSRIAPSARNGHAQGMTYRISGRLARVNADSGGPSLGDPAALRLDDVLAGPASTRSRRAGRRAARAGRRPAARRRRPRRRPGLRRPSSSAPSAPAAVSRSAQRS